MRGWTDILLKLTHKLVEAMDRLKIVCGVPKAACYVLRLRTHVKNHDTCSDVGAICPLSELKSASACSGCELYYQEN